MQAIDFLLISDPKIWAMPVKECGESLVDLRDYEIKISADRASFYVGFTRVRQALATKLMVAQKKLPKGLAFLFSEGHRPISLQQTMYEDYRRQLASANPSWDEAKVKEETVKYIAPPLDVPPHSTGGAIDITLIDDKNQRLDMGTILDETPDKNQNKNFTFAPAISEEARKNRLLLIKVLTEVGFVNYPAEWWHWSYGDKYWAYHTKQTHAIYNSTT